MLFISQKTYENNEPVLYTLRGKSEVLTGKASCSNNEFIGVITEDGYFYLDIELNVVCPANDYFKNNPEFIVEKSIKRNDRPRFKTGE